MLSNIAVILLTIFFHSSQSSLYYGLIQNISISNEFLSMNIALNNLSCEECLCWAFGESNIKLFTCNRDQRICQFYDTFPWDYNIVSDNEVDVYLIENGTFIETDDCCNTSSLITKIRSKTIEQRNDHPSLRFMSMEKNGIVVTSSHGILSIFNLSTLSLIEKRSEIKDVTTVGYQDGKFYVGISSTIVVYDENFLRLLQINVGETVNPIRFFKDKMFIGTVNSKIIVYEKNITTGIFSIRSRDVFDTESGQVHALAILNETTIYVGYDRNSDGLRVFTQNASGYWRVQNNLNFQFSRGIWDLFIDSCERLWLVEASTSKVFVYEKNGTQFGSIDFPKDLMNLIILDDYTLIGSQADSSLGFSRIQISNTSLRCRIRS